MVAHLQCIGAQLFLIGFFGCAHETKSLIFRQFSETWLRLVNHAPLILKVTQARNAAAMKSPKFECVQLEAYPPHGMQMPQLKHDGTARLIIKNAGPVQQSKGAR